MKNFIFIFISAVFAQIAFSQPLTGVKTIGPSGDYTTFNAASADLLLLGVGTGGVEFLVDPGEYNESVIFFSVPGASPTNRIRFVASADSVIIRATGTSATNDAGIRVNGGDYYTFDGIHIRNGGTSNANFCERGYNFAIFATPNNGCIGNIVKNCSIDMHVGTSVPSNAFGISSVNQTGVSSLNGQFSHNKIQNVKIDGVERGVSFFGALGFEGINNEVSNCIIGGGFGIQSQTPANIAVGILASTLKNTQIFGNTIVSVRCASNVTTGALGISSESGFSHIYSNTIHEVFQANSGGNFGANGIRVDANALGETFVYNNMVRGVDNAMVGSNTGIGICGLFSRKFNVGTAQSVHWYNNTMVLTSSTSKQVFTSSFMLNNENGGHVAHLKNNILINAMNGIGGFTQHCIIDFNNTAPSGKLISNNNCLTTLGTVGRIGRNLTPTQIVSITLADWQASNVGLDVNSVSVTPTFVSATDLHLVSGSNTGIENGGTPLSQVIGDIDFQVRNSTTPDMGADEILDSTLLLSLVTIISDMNPPIDCGTTVTFTATPTDAGSNPVFDWRINGILVATNVNPFITNQLNPGDEVVCEMTSSLLSNSSGPISSNTITADINPASLLSWFIDLDEDGFGNPNNTLSMCTQPLGFVSNNLDCNDNNALIFAGAPEICDGLDNDCDNGVDDGLVFENYFEDADADGFGQTANGQLLCLQPTGFINNNLDCDDNNALVNPSMPEICDGLDNDCVNGVDDGLVFANYFDDLDGDGFGGTFIQNSCLPPPPPTTCNGLYTVTVSSGGFLDETSWNMKNVSNVIIASGGPFASGSNNVFNLNLSNGPFTFNIETQGSFNDNSASFSVVSNGTTLVSGSMGGGQNLNFTNLCGNFSLPSPFVTIGGDCNENNNLINPSASEICGNGIDENCDGGDQSCITTQVQTSQCGAILSSAVEPIFANLVQGATIYRFKIQWDSNEVIVDRPERWFRFTDHLPGFAFNTTYQFSIAIFINGVFGVFGSPCDISLPFPQTQLQDSQCGITVDSATTPIFSKLISGATTYRFKIQWDTNEVIIDRPQRWFRFTNHVAGYTFNTTYHISVSTENNGSFSDYGPECTIFFPFPPAQIQESQCGVTLSSASDPIFSNLVQGISVYRFKIVSGSNEVIIDRPQRWFRFNDHYQGFSYNTTYQISVSLGINGVFSNYGIPCNVTLPFPTAQIQSPMCGAILSGPSDDIFANLIQGANAYKFKIQSDTTIIIIDRPERWFRFSQHVSEYIIGTTYQVSVAAVINGVVGGFGSTCDFTIPITPSANPGNNSTAAEEEEVTIDEASGFDAVAFPNPFADSFTLNIRSESNELVYVRVYDMSGKLLENRNLQAFEAATVVVGGNLAAGIYQVTVMQGDNVKTMKMIKTIR